MGRARYRKLAIKMWDDEWFASLSPLPPSGQGLWIYLLAGRETCTVPGLIRSGEMGMAEALGWSLEDFRECFSEVASAGHVVADWKRRIVWLPNAIAYNMPENPNVIKGWRVHIDELPRCELKASIIDRLEQSVKLLASTFIEAFETVKGTLTEPLPVPLPVPFRKQEQEQEQEQEQDPTRACAPVEEPTTATKPRRKRKAPAPIVLDDRMQEIRSAMDDITIPVRGWRYSSGTIADILGDRADEIASVLGGPAYPNVPPVSTLHAVRGWLLGAPDRVGTPVGLPKRLISWWRGDQEKAEAREAAERADAAARAAAPAPSPESQSVHRDPHVAAALRALGRFEDRRHMTVDEETLGPINQIMACDRHALPAEWQERLRGSARVELVDGFWRFRAMDAPPPEDAIAAARERMRLAAEAQETDDPPDEAGKGGW